MGDNGRQPTTCKNKALARDRALADSLLEKTECPFSWGTPMPNLEELQHQLSMLHSDGGAMTAMPWNEVILKTRMAAAFTRGKKAESEAMCRRYVVEAYMQIMPCLRGRSGRPGEGLEVEYGLPLRHLVDATWAFVCRKYYSASPAAMRDLLTFLQEGMVRADDLCQHFHAALQAIRAEIDGFPASMVIARRAVQMNPDEGQWHCTLAKTMMVSRRNAKEQGLLWTYSMQEEMTAAQTAFKLRKNIDAYLVLARIKEDFGYYSDAVELLREAMVAFPDSAYLAWQAAGQVRGLPKPHRDRRQAVRWYERALELTDGDFPVVQSHLATLLIERGDTKAAEPHMQHLASQMSFLASQTLPEGMTDGMTADSFKAFMTSMGPHVSEVFRRGGRR